MQDSTPCGVVLVVDDDGNLRELISAVLGEAGFAVEAAGDGAEALASAKRRPPELAVVDVCLPGVSGYELCRALKERLPALRVLLVSGERVAPLDRVVGLMIADDYLVKPFAPDELLARLRALGDRRGRRDDRRHGLTHREQEVLGCLAEGLHAETIAARLVISPKTVGTHLEHIFQKLGVHNQAQAVAAAYREELLR
ncbi:MAG TPA: response regulator transcription factor [Gaiellaceae bacterium]|jgi:DNA-binding NarL/FixJ family response regulator|nr:response regulator transcription factor [Gaiellaceae bacterium]